MREARPNGALREPALPPAPIPPHWQVLKIFLTAIAIGTFAAVVGAYYITLTVTFDAGVLAPFLIALAVLVNLSIGAMFLMHRQVAAPVTRWLHQPTTPVESLAWRRALDYSVRISLRVLAAALAVTFAIFLLSLRWRGWMFARHVAIGGALASVLDATFVYLYIDAAMRPVQRAMSSRDSKLHVDDPEVISVGLATQMSLVVINVSVAGAVISATLAYRAVALVVAGGDLHWLTWRIVLVTLASLAVTLGGCLLVASHVSRPARELVQMLTGLTPARYHLRFQPASTNEVAILGSTVNDMLAGLEERETIKDAFGRYVARQVSDVILNDLANPGASSLELGGQLLTITILMVDIRGFTPLTESLPPRQLVSLLNRYFTLMVEACLETGGTVDKFIGDAIMVEFGVPVRLDPGESALRAVRCALGMRERLRCFNQTLAEEDIPPIRVGMGIHTGEAIVGNIGSSERMDFTCIGDSVNTAARLETACKEVGTDALISEATYRLVESQVRVGEMKTVSLKGKKQPMGVYPLLALEESAQ